MFRRIMPQRGVTSIQLISMEDHHTEKHPWSANVTLGLEVTYKNGTIIRESLRGDIAERKFGEDRVKKALDNFFNSVKLNEDSKGFKRN